jgi:phage terminase large subunit-like protein
MWPSLGGIAVRWIQDNLILGEGDWHGRPFLLRTDQKLFVYRWHEFCPRCDQWRYDEAMRAAATGDGKTQFVAALVMLAFAGPSSIAPKSPVIQVAAASFEQANRLFSAVQIMCGGRDGEVTSAPLLGLFEVYDTEIKFADGRPGSISRLAAVAGTNEGGLPSLLVCDELHEWGDVGDPKARVRTVVGKSTRKRNTRRGSGRIINLSTAGFDKDNSLLGKMYTLGQRALRDRSLAPRLLFDWQQARDGLDYRLREHREIAVRDASKAADVMWSVADRVNDWGKPEWPSHEWIRYYANRFVDIADDSWLAEHPTSWADCKGTWESSTEHPWVLVVDMALKQDSVAVSRIEALPDGRYAITTRIWRAADSGGRIDHVEVWAYIRGAALGGGFIGVVYDPRFFEVPARMLEDDGIPTVEFNQDPSRMVPACGLAFQMILAGTIVHDGDGQLAAHVLAAVKRQQDRGFTLSKGKSKRHIDAAITLCMGVHVLSQATSDDFFY